MKVTFRDTAVYALEDLKPAEFYWAETTAEGISFVRRYRMKDGAVRTNPGALNPNIDHALRTPNESLKLLKILRQGGNDLFIFNTTCFTCNRPFRNTYSISKYVLLYRY